MTNDHLATALAILRDAAVEKDDALPPELAKALLEEIERIEERAQALTEQLLETGGELGKVQAHNNSLREALNKRVTDEPGDRNITTVGGIERFPVLQSGLMDTAPDVLKPCPFCGHEAAFKDSGVKGHDHFCVRVCCSNGSCGVCTPEHYKTREAAAMAWNRRSVNREAGQ